MAGVFKKAGIALFALLFAINADAQQQYAATVDTQMIVEHSAVFKNITEQVESREISLQKAYVTKEEEIKAAKDKLSDQKSAMSDEAYEKKLEDLNQELINFQNDIQYKGSMLQRAKFDALNTLQEKIIDIVADMAKKKNIDVVIPRGVALYASTDITTELLSALDKAIPSFAMDLKDFDESIGNKSETKKGK